MNDTREDMGVPEDVDLDPYPEGFEEMYETGDPALDEYEVVDHAYPPYTKKEAEAFRKASGRFSLPLISTAASVEEELR